MNKALGGKRRNLDLVDMSRGEVDKDCRLEGRNWNYFLFINSLNKALGGKRRDLDPVDMSGRDVDSI